MLSQYGSFRQQLSEDDWTVSVLSEGNLSTGDTIEFFVQAHNRVGLNKLSVGKTVTTTADSKIRLTFDSSAIATGEDTFKFVISARRGADTPKQIAEIYVREPNQFTFKALPISIDFTEAEHLSTNLIQALTTGDNRIDGQIRIVSGTAYRYDGTAITGAIQSSPGYWVEDARAGIVNVTNTRNQYGADQGTATADLVIPARLNTEGEITTEPIVFWWSNNLESNLGNFSPAGSGLNLRIYLNGALTNGENIPYGNLFSNLITVKLLGYVDIETGVLNTSLSGVNVSKQWTPNASGMTLPADLDPGFAAAYSISVEFSGDLLSTMLETGGTVGLELTKEPTPGIYEPSTGVLGDSVLDGLYVVPEQMLPGVVTLNNYRVTYRTPSYFVGLDVDTAAQKVAISNSPSGLARVRQGDLSNGEYLRAVVGTLPGTQSISTFSSPTYIASNESIALTVNYPVNGDTGLGIIRGDYPDIIAGNSEAVFNVPELIIYLHDTQNNIYYEVNPTPVVVGESQQIIISNLDNATEINVENLPSSSNNFGLFGYSSFNVSGSSTLGSFSTDLYRVAIAYHYPVDNLALTSVSHAPSNGALPQVRGALVDSLENNLYWLTPSATVAIAREISSEKLIHGAVLLVIGEEKLYRYDSYSTAEDDGDLVIKPTAITGAGRFLTLASGVGTSGLDDLPWNYFAKGELISWDGGEVTLVPRGDNGHYLKSDDSSPSGLSWAEVTGGGGLSFSLAEAPNQVVYNTSNGGVDLRPMWYQDAVDTSPSENCLVFTNATAGVMPHYFNIIPTPSGTVKRALLFDPVQEAYSWNFFTLAGLIDTYDTGTAVPHNSQLVYDAALGIWTPGIGRTETTLTNLLDTFIESPSDNYPLIWDVLTGKFIVGMPDLSAIDGLGYTTNSVAIPGDAFWANTKVLVSTRNPGQDLRGTLDSIAVINTSISSLSPYSGGTSSYNFQRTNRQSLQIETNSDTTLAGNTFALELFFRPGELISGVTYTLAARNNDVEVEFALLITETSPDIFNIRFFGYSTGAILDIELESNVSGGLAVGTWYHLAVTRNGNNWRLFVDGVVQQLVTAGVVLTSGFAFPSQIFLTLGRMNGLASNDDTQFVGQIEDFRLTLGNARYIASFTPPLTPLPVSAGGTRNVKDYFISFAGLTDVDETVEPEQDWVRAWSTVQGQYIPKPIGAGGEVVSLVLNQLTDVNVSAASPDYFLAKDSDGVWRGRTIGSGVTSVNGLSGVVTLTSDEITQGTTNLFLTPGAIATELAASNLEQLNNVQSTIADNLYLRKVGGTWQGASITFPVTGVNSKTGNITLTTTDITEETRLYYTNARVATHVNTLAIADFGGVFIGTPVEDKIVAVNADGKLTFVDAPTGGGLLADSDDLAEGTTNIYYTNARVATHVNTLAIADFGGVFTGTPVEDKIVAVNADGKLTFVDAPTGGGLLTDTDDLVEGTTNLYYTDTRVATHVNTLDIADFGGVFTGTVTEGAIPSVDSNGKLALGNPVPLQQFVAVTGSHSLVASNHGKIVQITNVSTVTLSSGLATGFQVTIFNETASVITFSGGATVKAKSLTCSSQYGAVYATHLGSDVWILVGDLD